MSEPEVRMCDRCGRRYSVSTGCPSECPNKFDYLAILPDAISMALLRESERGWRLRLEYRPDYSGHATLAEEQVLPERVWLANAHRVLASNGAIGLNLDEARWLRAQLDALIEIMEREERAYAARPH